LIKRRKISGAYNILNARQRPDRKLNAARPFVGKKLFPLRLSTGSPASSGVSNPATRWRNAPGDEVTWSRRRLF
jgi:hypothetical protein